MPEPTLYMLIDPATKEALRWGEGPAESGPLFFTTREKAEVFAREEGGAYEPYEIPAGVVARMKGKPHWIDPDAIDHG